MFFDVFIRCEEEPKRKEDEDKRPMRKPTDLDEWKLRITKVPVRVRVKRVRERWVKGEVRGR